MNGDESEHLSQLHLASGLMLQQEQRIGEAIREYRQAIALYPTAEAYACLGWALSLLGRYEEAIHCCHSAIALDPDYGNPYNDIGAYPLILERWDEVQPWLELA